MILLEILYQIIQAYLYIMFVYILLSWTPLVTSRFYELLSRICDPYLNIFRGKLIAGNMDFGGLIGLILLQVLLLFLRNAIY